MFISTDAGLVNAAHVSRIKTRTTHSGKDHHTLYSADGSSLGVSDDPDFDPDLLVASVIPAAPGTTVFVIADLDPKRDHRPTELDMWSEELPVLAWRCMSYGAEPIVWDQETLKAGRVFHRLPDGSISCPGAWKYPDLQQAIAGLLQWEQNAWDMRHPARAGAAA